MIEFKIFAIIIFSFFAGIAVTLICIAADQQDIINKNKKRNSL